MIALLGLGSGKKSPFDPSKYVGTKSWYDAANGSAGNAADTGAVGGKPLTGTSTYSASAAPNSKPCWTFNGTSHSMSNASPQGFVLGAEFSIIAVVKAVAGSTQYGILGTGAFGNGGESISTSTGNRALFTIGVAVTEFTAATNSWELWEVIAASAGSNTVLAKFYVNGALIGSTTVLATADTGGATFLSNASQLFGGSFAEGGFIDHALSNADRALFEAALGAKYALF